MSEPEVTITDYGPALLIGLAQTSHKSWLRPRTGVGVFLGLSATSESKSWRSGVGNGNLLRSEAGGGTNLPE